MAQPGDVDDGAPAPGTAEGASGATRSRTPDAHRPLPSVKMALLPHELRAARGKQVAIGGTLFALIAAGAVIALARPWLAALSSGEPLPRIAWLEAASVPPEPEPAPSPTLEPTASAELVPGALPRVSPEMIGIAARTAEAEAASAPEPAVAAAAPEPALAEDEDGVTRTTKPFGKARGFRDALRKAGASAADADGLIAALDEVVDFTRGQPEHELTFERDAGGTLVGFEYRAGTTERYRAERKGEKLVGRRVEVPIERRRIVAGGYVADSLGRALEGLGVKGTAAGMFVEAFEGKLDFKRDVREGDSFRVILEEELVEGQSLGYGRALALQFTSARGGRDWYAFWFETGPKAGDFYDETGRGLHGGWLRTPLRYDHLSSPFNLRRRHPILKRIMPHNGIDYAAAPGTTVWAAADGTVSFAGARGPNGNLVVIAHGNGHETFYAHLLRTARGIRKGTRVQQRQPIGAVGSTGRSTGPHLHFSLKRHGRFIDPAAQLNGPGQLLAPAHMQRFRHASAQLKRELSRIVLAAAPAAVGKADDPVEDFHADTFE